MAKSYRRRSTITRKSYAAGNSSRRRYRRPGFIAGILFVALLVGVGIGVAILLNQDEQGNLPGVSAANSAGAGGSEELFFEGIYVDGISLGGLTREQAKAQLAEKQKTTVRSLGVNIVDPEDKKIPLLVSDLPAEACSFDTDAVLDKAWQIGRQGTSKENQAAVKALQTQPVEMTTTATVDASSLEKEVRSIAETYTVEPQNAKLDMEKFDPGKSGINRLSFVQEVAGKKVDADQLWEAVKASFSGTFADVQIQLQTAQPDVTVDMLKELKLVKVSPITMWNDATNTKLNTANQGHTYTTHIKDHSDQRLTNIRLANNALSGVILPGQVFSMNESTGDRTQAQGYQVAPIDRSGIVDRGLGGGVCQVSGTLFNAAIRYGGKYEASDSVLKKDASAPGLTVTVRGSHSLPSAYLRTGTDATVDIASKKDLKLRNDFDKPVIIVLYYQKTSSGEYFEHCDIFGPALPDGATYDLLRKNVEVLPADTTTSPKTVNSKYAKPGAPNYIAPRDGYKVDIFIQKNVSGDKTEVKAYSDSYKAQPAYYYVFTGETAPTPTPSLTPTPTPTPTPSPTATKTEAPPVEPEQTTTETQG